MIVQEVFELGVRGLLFFTPAYFANAFALVFKGKKQIDFGKNFVDGKPIFGSGKTFRGFLLGMGTGVIAGVLTGTSLLLSFLISLGALLGDLAGAFLKRRLSIRPGDPAPVLDQFDFMLGAAILSQSWMRLDPRSIIIVMALTPLVHLVSNSVAFMLRIKKVPW